MSNATLLFGKPFFTFVMGFWFLVVGFVNPLTLSVGLVLLLWASWLLVMGLLVLILSYDVCHMFKFLI
jgi:hypothetical protein